MDEDGVINDPRMFSEKQISETKYLLVFSPPGKAHCFQQRLNN